MERRAVRCLTGALVALSLAAMPALAQNTNRTTTSTTFTTVRTDVSMPIAPEEDQIMALRTMADLGFSKGDYAKILPVLMDLRDAEQNYYASAGAAVYDLAFSQPDSGKDMRALDEVNTARNIYRDKQNSVWNTVSQYVGNDKAMALRRMVEPVSEDVSRTTTYRSARIDRIDSLISDLNRFAAAREASQSANAGQPGVSTVTVTTTTTTTTPVTVEPIYITTVPPLTLKELTDVIELRLAAMEASPEDLILLQRNRDITSPDIRFLREKTYKMWD